MIIRDGAKMSKSRGNVVIPDEYIEQWGADTFRTYLMFLGPYEEGGDFRDQGISGVRRFLDRLWTSVDRGDDATARPIRHVMRKLHQTIKKVTDDIPALSYNTAIAAMMEYMNVVRARRARRRIAPRSSRWCSSSRRSRRTSPRSCGSSSATSVSVFDSGWPAYDRRAGRRGADHDRRAGERQDARNDSGGAGTRTGRGARGGDGRSRRSRSS